MYPEQFLKLRRFSLAVGVILFSYVIAGFRVKEEFELPGFLGAFEIGRPELIPIGLVIASIWGLVRFWYYGLMIELAPWRHRRKIFASAKKVSDEGSYSIEFTRDSECDNFEIILQRHIPRFANRELLSKTTDITVDEPPDISEGIEKVKKIGNRLTFNISDRQRAAAWFQDLDFYSPVIVNVIALLAFFYRLLTTPEVVEAASKIPPS